MAAMEVQVCHLMLDCLRQTELAPLPRLDVEGS